MKAQLTALGLLAAGRLAAADVQLTTYAVELPQVQLAELMSAAGDSGDRLFASVRAEVASGGAKAIDTSLSRVRKGEECVIESIGEVITQAVDYDPPDTFSNAPPPPPKTDIRLPAPFASFQTRNTGITIEMEPTAYRDLIDLKLHWIHVVRWKDYVIDSWCDETGQLHELRQPHYSKREVFGAYSLKSGKWILASTAPGRTAEGVADSSRRVALFMRADTLETP